MARGPSRRYESESEDDEPRQAVPVVVAAPALSAATARGSGDGAVRVGDGADAATPFSDDDSDAEAAEGSGASADAVSAALASAALARAALSSQALLNGCRNVNAYRPLGKIEEGTYGVVFAAEEVATGEKVALKKVKMPRLTDFPVTALRETNVLLSLDHENIVRVREMVVGGGLDKVCVAGRGG